MGYRDILIDVDDHIATITLDRPEQMNALSAEMGESLVSGIQELGKDDEVRVVVLTGSGRAFCAGGDLRSMEARAERERTATGRLQALSAPARRLPVLLKQMPKPVIAAVNGAAMGWGCELAIACDIRIASEAARFGELFVRRGLVPDGGATYYLPRLIGMDKAAELIYTARVIDAFEAERIGLVTRVVKSDELMGRSRALAQEIATNAPLAVQAAKRMLYAQLDLSLEQAMEQVTMYLTTLRASDDHREGMRAFMERREPTFGGS